MWQNRCCVLLHSYWTWLWYANVQVNCASFWFPQSYDNKTFHSGTPPPFTMPGSGTTSSNLGNVSNVSAAAGYGPQLFIPNVPTAAAAAAAHQQHHLHQNAHHQVGFVVLFSILFLVSISTLEGFGTGYSILALSLLGEALVNSVQLGVEFHLLNTSSLLDVPSF